MHNAPASAVTLGLLSYITAITPRGVLILSMSSPLGLFHLAICCPTGSLSFAIALSPSDIDLILSSFKINLSRNDFDILFSLAFLISRLFASKIFLVPLSILLAILVKDSFFCCVEAKARLWDDFLAFTPISNNIFSISLDIYFSCSTVNTRLSLCIISGLSI